MTLALLAIIALMAIMVILFIVIARLLKSDDFDEMHIIATYQRGSGIVPARLVMAGEKYCMVYENEDRTAYGIGIGKTLDELQLLYDVPDATLVSIAAEGDNVIWSHVQDGELTTYLCDLAKDELTTLCEGQSADIVPGYVGIYEGYVYYAREYADAHRVSIVRYNLETGDQLELESVQFFGDIERPIRSFKMLGDVMNIIEQDTDDEIRLVAVALETRNKGTTLLGINGKADPDNYMGCLDDAMDVAPNLARMSYMIIGEENGRQALYEAGDKKFAKRIHVDNGKVEPMSINSFEGIIYWIENSFINGRITPVLHGYNSRANQQIMTIIGASSYTIHDQNMYYFYRNDEKNIMALCSRPAAGNVKTLDIEEIKRERKAQKKAAKAARRDKNNRG